MAAPTTRAHQLGVPGWPWAAGDYGPLPAMLVLLTAVTGLVDALSLMIAVGIVAHRSSAADESWARPAG